ncbi:MAG: DUF4361 domain-containing protein [Proteiniphilum sp.]
MKRYIGTLIIFLLLFGLSSCNEEDYASKEYYKNVVYLLSKESYNVYSEALPFNDGQEVTGYISVGCGGSLSNPSEFTVELGKDSILFNLYNKSNYDIDTTKYAKLLSESQYRLETTTVKFPANNSEQYVKVAISVVPDGLSPDTVYFVPITIKNVSNNYEVNSEKSDMLYRVLLKNYYAEQLPSTYYQAKGDILDLNGEVVSKISTTKLVRPLSKNSVRTYVANEVQTSKSTEEEIKKYSIVLSVDENNQVEIAPYGTIDVQKIDKEGSNFYEEVVRSAVDTTLNKYFHVSYKYRILKTPATQTTPAVYDNWITIDESLKRLDN